jgi:hypothetical protein
MNNWQSFVSRFFSETGVLRQSLWNEADHASKEFEIQYAALARYYFTHFDSGVRNVQIILQNAQEKELPNNSHFVECQKANFIYWFDNGSQVSQDSSLLRSL